MLLVRFSSRTELLTAAGLACRYRQKRHERNFNKRIKYMCRKTLADSRPRVRGRFARNDDTAAVMPHETKKALAEKARKEKKGSSLTES